jgi:prepilin-type N-terminal cleavage/methylation domain-containing protein
MRKDAGQSLIEVLIALTIGGILISAAAFTIAVFLRVGLSSRRAQEALSLARTELEQVHSFARGNWNDLYTAMRLSEYSVIDSMPPDLSVDAIRGCVIDMMTAMCEEPGFEWYFQLEDVERDTNGDIVGGAMGTVDPSTLKVTSVVEWSPGGGAPKVVLVTIVDYVTRWQNRVFHQSDWRGNPAEMDPVIDTTDGYDGGTNVFITPGGSVQIDGIP